MFSTAIFLTSALAITTTAHSCPAPIDPAHSCPHDLGATGVDVRLPPSLSTNTTCNDQWQAPPPGWYFKHWDSIYSSNTQELAFRNMQYDPTALDPKNPEGPVNDLSSFQLPGNDTVYTTYGIDTPDKTPGYTAVLDFQGTGILVGSASNYSIMAWGCDTQSIPYYVSYSTAVASSKTPAGIDILSTNDKGPDNLTVTALMTALKALQSTVIQPLVANLTKMNQDGGRDGMPRVDTCDSFCQSNKGLIGLF